MKNKLLITGTATLLLAGAAACSSTAGTGAGAPYGAPAGTTSAAPAQAGASAITIAGFAFTGPLTVAPGAAVSVANSDSAEHTVTADDGKSFDVDALAGKTETFTAPTAPGTYKFHCSIHPSMHGTLIVK